MNFKPVREVANQLGIAEDHLELYGKYKAKVNFQAFREKSSRGKLIMVTAMTPTRPVRAKPPPPSVCLMLSAAWERKPA
jgi:formyltetrahydrofolate synthetase